MKLSDVRRIVRRTIAEALSTIPTGAASTIPASKSSSEQEFEKQVGGRMWGSPQSLQRDPVKQKANLVLKAMEKSGKTPSEAEKAKVIDHLRKMDPSDMLVKTADELANEITGEK